MNDDAPFFMFRPPNPRPIQPASHPFEIWTEELEALYHESGKVFVLTMHPQLIGRPSRVAMLRRFIAFARALGDVRFTTCADVAQAFLNWSHDNQRVAFVGVSSENDGTAFLYTAALKDAKPLQLFRSEHDFPFYLSWSPDSKRIAFLTQGEQDLSLNYSSADGAENKTLDKGNPFYFSWSPDSQSL